MQDGIDGQDDDEPLSSLRLFFMIHCDLGGRPIYKSMEFRDQQYDGQQ